jgi:hypothetical protein
MDFGSTSPIYGQDGSAKGRLQGRGVSTWVIVDLNPDILVTHLSGIDFQIHR